MDSSTTEEYRQPAAYRVFVDQTAAVIHVLPSFEADVVTRLERGLPLDLLPITSENDTQWLPVRTSDGLEGYMVGGTKTITSDILQIEREKIQRGYALARTKMLIGLPFLIVGIFIVVAPYLTPSLHGSPAVLYFTPLFIGAGEFFWGVEQISYVRRALDDFDVIWYRAFPEKHNRPLF